MAVRGLGAFAAVVAIGLVAAAPAGARIAFVSDESIQTMRADGSHRVRLTAGRPFTGPIADETPLWSPSGRTIVFQRFLVRFPGAFREEEIGRLWAMDADGSHKRAVLPDPGPRTDDYLLAMLPSGEALVWRHRSGKRRDAVLAVDPATGRARAIPNGRRFIHSSIAFSPSGRRVLYTDYKLDRQYTEHPSLYEMDFDGSRRRLLARDAGYGRYSPDGHAIAFVSERDHHGSTCDSDECEWNGEIYTMDRRARHLRRLTVNRADDRDPGWSADGSRISFSSGRNFPSRAAPEIYTIRRDGRCLTWLTNGSADSAEPAFDPTGHDTDPGRCGAAGRKPRVDLDLTGADRPRAFPLYWLGPVTSGRIIPSYVTSDSAGAFGLSYSDCGYFDPRDCGRPVDVDNEYTCPIGEHTPAGDLLDRSAPDQLHLHGDVLFSEPGPDRTDPKAYAGLTTIAIDRRGRGLVRTLGLLRRFDGAAGGLPPTGFSDAFWDALLRVHESYARTHDHRRTASELHLTVSQVKHRLRLGSRLRKLGVDRHLDCRA